MRLNFKAESQGGGRYSQSSVALLACAMMLFSADPRAFAQGRQKPAPAPPPAAPVNPAKTGPLSLADVEVFVAAFKDGDVFEKEVIERINARGIAFAVNDETIGAVRAKGANENILDAIRKFAPPRPAPPPPKVKLRLNCAPAECVIKINGQSIGSTQDGWLTTPEFGLGNVTVDFEKEGYIPQQKNVAVALKEAPPVSVTLEMTGELKAGNGKKLLALMLGALGIAGDLKGIGAITAGGSLTSYSAGKPSEWNFEFTTGPPLIEMKLGAAGASLVYLCKGEKCAEKKRGKLLRGPKPPAEDIREALEANLRKFERYNLFSMLQLLTSSSVRLSAISAEAVGGKEQRLSAESDSYLCDVTLAADLHPGTMEYESKGGLGSRLKISYGHYTKVGAAQYPKWTAIRLPEPTQDGLEINLDHVELGSAIREEDFPK